MTNKEKFKETYAKNLKKAIETLPDDYIWTVSETPYVLERMNKAIDAFNFNKDSHAFRWTCRDLGIKHTYKAIREFLDENN